LKSKELEQIAHGLGCDSKKINTACDKKELRELIAEKRRELDPTIEPDNHSTF